MGLNTDPSFEGRPGPAQVWLFAASLALNVLLATWLIHAGRGRSDSSHGATIGFDPAAVVRVNRAKSQLAEVQGAPPFRWSDLESTSYPEYIARLRAIHCPESVIRDIILADIAQLYTDRVRQIWTPPKREYWQKPPQNNWAGRPELKKLMELDTERQELQKALLGSATRQQDLIDLAFLQVHGPEQSLAWLPEDRRAAALAALDTAGYFREEDKSNMEAASGRGGMDRFREMEKKQLHILEGILTPDELKEFQMRTSQAAGALRGDLRYFQPTQAEFDALTEFREKRANDPSIPRDFYAAKAAECAAVQEVLGPDRAREYQQTTDLFYVWSRQAAERYGLPEETAAQAVTVKTETMAAADQIRRDNALAEDEKKRRLTDLQHQAEAQLNGVMGAQAARFARKGDGAWLDILPQRLVP